jgi:hypothetical protein
LREAKLTCMEERYNDPAIVGREESGDYRDFEGEGREVHHDCGFQELGGRSSKFGRDGMSPVCLL